MAPIGSVLELLASTTLRPSEPSLPRHALFHHWHKSSVYLPMWQYQKLTKGDVLPSLRARVFARVRPLGLQ